MPATSARRRSKAIKTEQAAYLLANRMTASLRNGSSWMLVPTRAQDSAALKVVAESEVPPIPPVEPEAAAKTAMPEASEQDAGHVDGSVPSDDPAAFASVMGQNVERWTQALSSFHDMARDAARLMIEHRAAAAGSTVRIQRKMLEITASQFGSGFSAMQKLLRVQSVGEVLKIQADYTEQAVQSLSAQARELRDLSADLTQEVRRPLAEQMTKNFARIKGLADH